MINISWIVWLLIILITILGGCVIFITLRGYVRTRKLAMLTLSLGLMFIVAHEIVIHILVEMGYLNELYGEIIELISMAIAFFLIIDSVFRS